MNEPHLASAEFGGFWIRVLALLADSAIVFLIAVLIIAGGATALGEEGASLAVLAAWLFSFLYWPVMHASKLQATFGKALLGLRVTGYQGNRISILRSLGRELAKILSGAALMVGYIMAGFTARKQALHDLVASTYVVREGRARIVAALAATVAGFVLPFVVLPLVVGSEMVSAMMTAMMSGMEQAQQQPAMTAVQQPPVAVPAPKPQPALAPVAEAPAPAAKPAALAPAPEAKVPEVAKAVEVAKPVAEVAKPAPEAKPAVAAPVAVAKKVEPRKVQAKKVAAKRAAPRPRPVAVAKAPAVFEPKAAGLKFNDLVTAVLYRDAEAVSELLKFGRWPDKPDSRGTTPLMLAVEFGDAGSAEALLRAGAEAGRALPVARARRDGAMLDLLKRYAAR